MTDVDFSLSSEYVNALIEQAKEQGCDVDLFLRELNISATELEPGQRFSAVKYGQLYRRIMLTVEDECFGMMSDGRVRLGSFRLLCLTVVHCSTLAKGIMRAAEFSEICRGFIVKPEVVDQPDSETALVRMVPISDHDSTKIQNKFSSENADQISTLLAAWHRFCCWMIGDDIPIRSVSFNFPYSADLKQFAEALPAETRFDQPFNAVEFNREYLDRALVLSAASVDDFVRSAPYHLVVQDSLSDAIAPRVKALLSRQVGNQILNAEVVAETLNMAPASLRRKLANEGTSFQRIKNECRLEAAVQYLGYPELSIREIAERMGFDEVSTFYRSFKNWTGMTPTEYRQTLLETGIG